MKKISPNLILLFFLLLSIVANAQAGITVSPPRSYFTSNAGESSTKKVLVTNPSKTTTLELTVSLSDWKYDEKGNNIISEPGSLENSAASWITIQPQSYFSLSPGETKELEVTVTPPEVRKDVLPVHTSLMYITQTNPVDAINEKGALVKVSVRTGIKIYHRYSSRRDPNMDFTDYKFEKDSKSLLLEIVNQGNVWTDGTIHTEMINQQNGTKYNLEDQIIYTVPSDKRIMNIPLPKGLERGKYIVTSTFTYGDDNVIKMAELTFINE
ncbi:molecular chaperone [Elizabethkingia meningoseptica]|uniref:fimbrial biogenesis chaperone n=1 Tax=Elizabethkingia meningoseptica TaxID=238 RepID=UPI00301879B5